MLIFRLEVRAFLNDQLGQHGGFLWCLAEVEENKMQSCVAVFVWHIHIDFKSTVSLAILHEVSLDDLASKFELCLSKGHMHW